MKSQNNSTAFQIVAVVGLLIHGILTILGDYPILGIRGLLVLAGTGLLVAGILLANSKFMAIGVLMNIAREILYAFSWLQYISFSLRDGHILYLAWAYVWPIVMWILIVIAINKSDKSLVLCGIAAAVGTGLALLSYGISGIYRIVDILFCIAIALLGYALQNGMQSVFESRPVETPKTVSNQYENLIKLKDLLDSGAITQEEFDQKKKELLEV